MIKIENKIINSYKSNLKKIRTAIGMTQQELSELSGINIKSIAAYEQNPEKINKASLESVYNISDCLGCSVEDLIEKQFLEGKVIKKR